MVYSTFYSNNKPLSIKGLFMLFFLMPCFVYGQSEAELQEQMSVLYQKANKMYKALPQKDYRGFYFTGSLARNHFGNVQYWGSRERVDEDGNALGGVDTIQYTEHPKRRVLSLGVEFRPLKAVAIGFSGSYMHQTQSAGTQVVAQNGASTRLQVDYNMSQFMLSSRVLVYVSGNFYIGGGLNVSKTSASGFQTHEVKEGSSPTQYLPLMAEANTPKKTAFEPIGFMGFKASVLPNLLVGVEVGFGKRIFSAVQISIPLTKKVRKSLKTWQVEYKKYRTVFDEAESIDRQLNPEKFETSSSDTSIGN